MQQKQLKYNDWAIISWSFPQIQGKHYSLFWVDQDKEKWDFAHTKSGRVRCFRTRSGARGIRHRLRKGVPQ